MVGQAPQRQVHAAAHLRAGALEGAEQSGRQALVLDVDRDFDGKTGLDQVGPGRTRSFRDPRVLSIESTS